MKIRCLTVIFSIILVNYALAQTFSQNTSDVIVNDGGNSKGCCWGDFDNDGYLDLFVANFYQKNYLYKNNVNGLFTKITESPLINETSDSYSCSWCDYDNDNDLDLFVANFNGMNNFLYSNLGDGTFTKITDGSIVNDGQRTRCGAWGDYNNDGFLDLYIVNGLNDANILYKNNGNGSFTEITSGLIVEEQYNSCIGTWVDYDNDGDLDLFVTNRDDNNNELFVNSGSNNNRINISCVGDDLTNKSAIGTKIRIKANINGIPTWQMREIYSITGRDCQSSLRAHFGLGDATIIDTLKIEWTSGIVNIYTDVNVNQFLTITENDPVVPVELASFYANYIKDIVILMWKTESESNNYGFEIQRALENVWETLGFVNGKGTTTATNSYEFADNISDLDLNIIIKYRLKQIDVNGSCSFSDIVDIKVDRPVSTALIQNYPNPFNSLTKIKYSLSQPDFVTIKIYDMIGKEIEMLISEIQETGDHSVEFDASELSSGIYLYQLIVRNQLVDTKKMMYVK